ncbi:MAG: endonuclease MutS2 [Anaerolineales bacterium]|nr:endonuclease MutS2 [Anaerolineales bacterium]
MLRDTLRSMDEKALNTLEFPKVLERLAQHTAFTVSHERAVALRPAGDIDAARTLLAETSEARALLADQPTLGVGGARDVRPALGNARRGMALTAPELLDIKGTLVAARTLVRQLQDAEASYPLLAALGAQLPQPSGVVDAITKAISERGQVLDHASERLAEIRRELNIAHERLLSRMQKMLSSEPYSKALQEPIFTQRDGRYVLPIRAEERSRVKGIVHDQSASGATLFIEPLGVVELNNTWRELQLAEREEERRILLALTALVQSQADEIGAALEGLAMLDLVFARAKYAEQLRAHAPELLPLHPHADGPHPGVTLRLFEARHPLLATEKVVSSDIELFPENYCLVITGPNTGGKTVTLKTVGLLALMGQSGLHIPAAAGSQLSFFESVYADIGDEQSIEQSLSTFSGHITNIVSILKQADQRSLVIFDELGAGTDPQEGAALARALLDHLVRRGITTLVATHYPELKVYAQGTKGVVNASVEFDLKTLAPTYHLTVGLPGRSNALAIAKRLGLSEDVLEQARSGIDPADLKAEDLLDDIHRERERARQAHERAAEAEKAADELRTELAERLEHIEDERVQLLEAARQQAKQELDALKTQAGRLRADLARERQPLAKVQAVKQAIEALEETVEEPVERRAVPESAPNRPLRLGDSVRVRSLGARGVVIGLSEEEVEVQVGALRARARYTDLELLNEKAAEAPDDWHGAVRLPDAVPSEISLRGMRFEDAYSRLDAYLDSAYASGLRSARVIHGKGTGTLREMARDMLRKREYVERYNFAESHEGGEGVTIAYFR